MRKDDLENITLTAHCKARTEGNQRINCLTSSCRLDGTTESVERIVKRQSVTRATKDRKIVQSPRPEGARHIEVEEKK